MEWIIRTLSGKVVHKLTLKCAFTTLQYKTHKDIVIEIYELPEVTS